MKKIFLAAVCMVALAACGNNAKKNVQDAAEPVADAVAAVVDMNGEWTVAEVVGADVANAETTPFFVIDLEGKTVSGNIGCNSVNATLLLDAAKGIIGFENAGSTRMMCADMSVEDAMLKALVDVRNFEAAEDGTVVLKNAAGEKLIVLKKNQ